MQYRPKKNLVSAALGLLGLPTFLFRPTQNPVGLTPVRVQVPPPAPTPSDSSDRE
jgi:hypothetical protein